MSWTCLRTAQLISARAAGLSEADRLRLEEHLDSCAGCRSDARTLDALAELAAQADRIALSDRALGRMVNTALRTEATPRPAPAARLARGWMVLAGVGLAAAGVAFYFADGKPAVPDPVAARAPAPVPAPAAAPTHIVAGSDPAHVHLGHADVELSALGELSWDPARSTVALHTGTLLVAVDPAPHLPFNVKTERFTVEVVGTRFEVTATSVRVFDGIVRVRAPSGELLVESLGAGGSWHLDDTTATASAAAATAPSPPPAGPRESAAKLLAAARKQLAAGHPDDARELIADARRARPSRAELAEADTLLAECALVDGDRAKAARLYRTVANRYPDLPAGESALYAAAGLEAKAGRTEQVRSLAKIYRKRYPKGRFSAEIDALLARLD